MEKKLKSRNCPKCGWKFPISQVKAPINRVNGTMFNCPQCHVPLVYKSEHTKLYSVCTAITIPFVIIFNDYKDIPIVRDFATFILIPILIFITILWRRGEYVEPYKP